MWRLRKDILYHDLSFLWATYCLIAVVQNCTFGASNLHTQISKLATPNQTFVEKVCSTDGIFFKIKEKIPNKQNSKHGLLRCDLYRWGGEKLVLLRKSTVKAVVGDVALKSALHHKLCLMCTERCQKYFVLMIFFCTSNKNCCNSFYNFCSWSHSNECVIQEH